MNALITGDTLLLADWDRIINAVGAHVLRINPGGSIEGLIISPDSAGWMPLEEMELVQVTSTTNPRARRN